MILLYLVIGIVSGLGLVAVAVWLGLYPSIANRESSLPELSDNPSSQVLRTSGARESTILSNCRDGKRVIQSSH